MLGAPLRKSKNKLAEPCLIQQKRCRGERELEFNERWNGYYSERHGEARIHGIDEIQQKN
jgi:hypothetical protein